MKRYYIFRKDGNYSFGLLDLDRLPVTQDEYTEFVRKYDESCSKSGSLLYITGGSDLVLDEITKSIKDANKVGALDLDALIKRVDILNGFTVKPL